VDPDLLDVSDLNSPLPECREKSFGDAGSILAAHGHQMGELSQHADLTVLAPPHLLHLAPGSCAVRGR